MCIMGMWSRLMNKQIRAVDKINSKDFDRMMADCDSKREASAVIKRRLSEARKNISEQ